VWVEEDFGTGTGCKVEILVSDVASSISMGEALSHYGDVPIPPYLYRDTTPSDQEDYQTVYAAPDRAGSVAAPTAGLHFTKEVLQGLEAKGVEITRMALHVSAGTFKPVTVECISEHTMHEESFTVDLPGLLHVANSHAEGRLVVAVGTTSVRVSESLYWLGVKSLLGKKPDTATSSSPLSLLQWEPSELRAEWERKATVEGTAAAMPSPLEAFQALAIYGTSTGTISGTTALCITPGYVFMVVRDGLLTNFHQPDSTLMLLVAAFLDPANASKGDTGNGVITLHKLYKHAIDGNYRFLSFGDCCLLTKFDVKDNSNQ
jgi:S-adenosylmethionine:tRNA ribosyltransferase-isomerase